MNNEDTFKKQKQVLSNIQEIQEHHAFLLNHHFKSVELESEPEDNHDPTAFPTPNQLYKQHINKTIKDRKPIEPME